MSPLESIEFYIVSHIVPTILHPFDFFLFERFRKSEL